MLEPAAGRGGPVPAQGWELSAELPHPVSSSSHREANFEKCFMPSLEVTASVYPVAEQAGLDVRRERATVSVDGEMVV